MIEKIRSILFEEQKKQSVFYQRTDSTSAKQYFQFYGLLSQQQGMLQVQENNVDA